MALVLTLNFHVLLLFFPVFPSPHVCLQGFHKLKMFDGWMVLMACFDHQSSRCLSCHTIYLAFSWFDLSINNGLNSSNVAGFIVYFMQTIFSSVVCPLLESSIWTITFMTQLVVYINTWFKSKYTSHLRALVLLLHAGLFCRPLRKQLPGLSVFSYVEITTHHPDSTTNISFHLLASHSLTYNWTTLQ